MNLVEEFDSQKRSAVNMTGGLSPTVIANIAKRSATAVRVLMFFVENLSKDNCIDVLQSDICYALNVSQKTVVECIKILEDEGSIVKKRKGIFNRYFLEN